MTSRRLLKAVPALALIALALPASASAQATRTWVSGVGDDVNPCSRTAPCKTFAGAISKTAAGGMINCLDPGGFGAVTIVKSMTIRCNYTEGGALAGGNGVTVNAPDGKVVLKGLDIFGVNPPSHGVRIVQAKSVHLIDNDIAHFPVGVSLTPTTSAQTRVYLRGNYIHDNGIGFLNAPNSATVSFSVATLRNNDIVNNTCGVGTSSFGPSGSPPTLAQATADCGTAAAGALNKTAVTSLYDNVISQNGFGVFVRGGLATAELAGNRINGNNLFGLRRIDGGVLRTFTPATNVLSDNAATDTTNASTPMVRRKRR